MLLHFLVVSGTLFLSDAADSRPTFATGDATSVETATAQVSGPSTCGADDKPEPAELPEELLALFRHLDEFGRDKVKEARFVKVTFVVGDISNARQQVDDAWLIEEDEQTVTLLRDDLIPWIYNKKRLTKVPGGWDVASAQLKSVADAAFEAVCKTMCQDEEEPEDEDERVRRRMDRLHAPGPISTI